MLGGKVGNTFRLLEGQAFFETEVGGYFEAPRTELKDFISCEISVDPSRINYAFNEYAQNIAKFSLYLEPKSPGHAKDPDHYKRAGALLHALYLSQPITSVTFNPPIDEVDALATPLDVRFADVDRELTFAQFYRDYANEFTSFALAYDICRQYEDYPRDINKDYLRTVCTYLYNNRNLSVESLFMLFKSLML